MSELLHKLTCLTAPWAARLYFRLLRLTCRFEYIGEERAKELMKHGSVIAAFWHSVLLVPILYYANYRPAALVSKSKDGDIISSIMLGLGYQLARGSSSSGGVAGYRDSLRLLDAGRNLLTAVDGPRGPAGVVKPGVAATSRMSGRPVIPTVYDCTRKHVFKSWDRFVLPLPFSRIRIVFGDPIPPEETDDAGLKSIKQGLDKAVELAKFPQGRP